jgi:hypothetical protein
LHEPDQSATVAIETRETSQIVVAALKCSNFNCRQHVLNSYLNLREIRNCDRAIPASSSALWLVHFYLDNHRRSWQAENGVAKRRPFDFIVARALSSYTLDGM